MKRPKHRVRYPVFAAFVLAGLSLAFWRIGRETADAQSAETAPAVSVSLTQPAYGTLDPLTRLLPIDTYLGPLNGSLELNGGRNEIVDQQLALFAAGKPWDGVTVQFSDLKGPNGARVPSALLHWRRVGSVRTKTPYYPVRYVGLWPDPLLPAAPMDIAARSRAFVWIDLHIPTNNSAGLYQGSCVLKSQNAAPITVPIHLHIWGFTIPKENHLRTAFGSQGDGPKLDRQAMIDNMFEHRISPEYTIGWPKRIPATLPGAPDTYDWTEVDHDITRRLAQGMTGFALVMNAENNSDAESAQRWETHLRQHGWLKYAYTYLADEPEWDKLAPVDAKTGEIKRAAPALKNMVTARGFPEGLKSVDIWCPNMIYFDAEQAKQEQARGHEVWWYPAYPTVHPMINLWTDYPALDDRVWLWMTWKQKIDGILYWSVSSWGSVSDPLADANTFASANGDGALIYPGPSRKPLDSIRWEALRDGLQDYEVFCLLEAGANELHAQGKAPQIEQEARRLLAINDQVVASWTQYNPDPQALLSARQQMNITLEKMVTALGHAPKIVGHPQYRPAETP